jgi:hypothetical protein
MFKIGDVIFIDNKEHKYYTITEFYISVSQKRCAYIKPNDGIMPEDYDGYRLLSRGVCGVTLERLTHITYLTPDWEV